MTDNTLCEESLPKTAAAPGLAMRTHLSEAVGVELLGQEIAVCGWVQSRRDHGSVIFIDLRDRKGLVQLVTPVDGGSVIKNC